MKLKPFLLTSIALMISAQVNAQTTDIEVTNGTDGTCYRNTGAAPCGFYTAPTISSLVDNGVGQSSEVKTTATQTIVTTTDGTQKSLVNILNNGAGLQSFDSSIGSAGLGTQVGTSSATGDVTSQVVGTASNTTGGQSELALEGKLATIRTRTDAGVFNLLETTDTRTLVGYSSDGVAVTNGLLANATGVELLGNTTAKANLTVVGLSTLNGINNQSAGITNAGLISGVTAGAVSAASTEAINGSQLFTTNANVTTAQSTASAAAATANTASTTATAAQTAATSATATANAAQSTANTASTTATAAQTAATSATAAANAAQSTANTALTTANGISSTATAAQTAATSATVTANAAQSTANTALTTANGISSIATAAQTTANNAQTQVTGLNTRVSALESTVNGFANDIRNTNDIASRGTAIATAIGSIPDVDAGKNIGVGVGVGTYNGKTAFAVSIGARVSSSVRLRLNAGTSGNGKVAAGVGGTFSW